MPNETNGEIVAATMGRINRAWLDGRIDELEPVVHQDIVMVFPGFGGRIQGRDQFLAGFHDFCSHAKVHEFREHDQRVDVAGRTAVVSFQFEMVYERSGERYRSTGRDLWVFQHEGSEWIAVWRTMLDIEDSPVSR
jgi:ketosteroid isomerase-like protein